MMKVLKKNVEELVGIELMLANQNYPMFHSVHEAYGVISEEIVEARQEIFRLHAAHDEMLSHLSWNNSSTMKMYAEEIRDYAIAAACELIQVAAMGEKTIRSLEEKK